MNSQYLGCQSIHLNYLAEVDRWKATEFRQFLLYTGMVALRGILPIPYLQNFQILAVAIYFLSSPGLSSKYCDYAQQLLVVFVKQVEQLYGSEYLVYNVHSLIHLADDVRLFGNLDHISAFPFENYLRKLKRLVKQPREPLQQIVRRVIEKKKLKIELQTSRELKLTCLHYNGPVPVDVINVADVQQYAVAHMANYVVSLKVKDNCLLTSNYWWGCLSCKKYSTHKFKYILCVKCLTRKYFFLNYYPLHCYKFLKSLHLILVFKLFHFRILSANVFVFPLKTRHLLLSLFYTIEPYNFFYLLPCYGILIVNISLG